MKPYYWSVRGRALDVYSKHTHPHTDLGKYSANNVLCSSRYVDNDWALNTWRIFILEKVTSTDTLGMCNQIVWAQFPSIANITQTKMNDYRVSLKLFLIKSFLLPSISNAPLHISATLSWIRVPNKQADNCLLYENFESEDSYSILLLNASSCDIIRKVKVKFSWSAPAPLQWILFLWTRTVALCRSRVRPAHFLSLLFALHIVFSVERGTSEGPS